MSVARLLFGAAVLLGCFTYSQSYAQTKFTFSGSVRSAQSGETLIGANVVVKEMKNVGASTNAYGY